MAWRPALLYSTKTAAAALMALGIALMLGLPMPFWAMSTAYIISNPLSGATRSKAIYRVAGTAIGGAAAVLMVPLLVNAPMLLSLALAVWVGGCLAISLLDRRPRSYVVMLAGYTAALIAFPSVERPEAIFDVAQARLTEILLGITCATVVHSVFWPRAVSDVLGPRLTLWIDDAESWLREAMMTGATTDRDRLAVDALDCAMLASHVPFDTSHWREASASVQALLRRMLVLLPLLSGLADRRVGLGDDPKVAATTSAVTGWLDAGSHAADLPALAPALSGGAERDWPGLLRECYVLRLAQALAQLAECRQLLAHLGDPRIAPPTLTAPSQPMRLTNGGGFALLSGLSAAAAIMLCCALWIWTGWADGASAAAMTAVFCCMFAALDNPVPAILMFGGALSASTPLAGIYLFGILPAIDGFVPLVAVVAPMLIVLGLGLMHPRRGIAALAIIVGFCSTLALQEDFHPDFARFANSSMAQIVAVVLAAGVTAGVRNIGADSAIAALVRRLQGDLTRLARAPTPPDATATLNRAVDQIALLSQRMHSGTVATMGLREVRLALNIVEIQHMRQAAARPQRIALARLLQAAARHFAQGPNAVPPPELLTRIDNALRGASGDAAPSGSIFAAPLSPGNLHGRAALVALRRSLYPAAPFAALPQEHAS